MRHPIRPVRICGLLLVASSLVAVAAGAEQFPGADQLPSQPNLPDPLVLRDGTKVTTPEQWQNQRKPELRTLFQHYMYGYLPAAPKIRAQVKRVDNDALGGKATMKQVEIALGPPECPKIDLLVFVPNHPAAEGKPPVFLGLSFTGNHSVLDDPRIALCKSWMRPGPGVENHRATEASRGKAADRWQIERTIDRGYAVATFYYGDVMPDKPDFSEGVDRFIRASDATERPPTAWGALAMWAWGLHRAVDYLVGDAQVDGRRIVVFGHSRNGKAALLAAAFDERIAAAIPHQAGCGGTAPSRRKNPKGEPVAAINKNFPHWFDDVFKTFNGREDRLPFDQNCLVALCAPRPVLLSCGEQDQWADPPGQLDVLRSASPVYRLLGAQGLAADAAPADGTLLGTDLCYYICNSPHTVDQAYWDVFVQFADQCFHIKR